MTDARRTTAKRPAEPAAVDLAELRARLTAAAAAGDAAATAHLDSLIREAEALEAAKGDTAGR